MIPANVVAITFFKPSLELWNELKVNTELTLEREPNNPRDKNAIKVIYKGFHLGYVERDVAVSLAATMDQGQEAKAIITRTFGTPTDRPHIETNIVMK